MTDISAVMTNKPDGRSIPVRQDVVMPEIARMYREVEAERDELRAEVERLQAALTDLVDATAPDSNMARVFAARKTAAALLARHKEC